MKRTSGEEFAKLEQNRKSLAKERQLALKRARYAKNPWPDILREARSRAKRRGIDFTITVDDLKFPAHCPYLGVPLWGADDDGGTVWLNTPSLDRIDSSKGYIPGNVQVISVRANRAKSDLSEQELRTFAMNVLRIQGEQCIADTTSPTCLQDRAAGT